MKESNLINVMEDAGIEVIQVSSNVSNNLMFIKNKLLPISVFSALDEKQNIVSSVLILNTKINGISLEKINKINRVANYFKVFKTDSDKVVFEYKIGSKDYELTNEVLIGSIQEFENDIISVLDEASIQKIAQTPVVELMTTNKMAIQ